MFLEYFLRTSTWAEHFACITFFNPTCAMGNTAFCSWRSGLPHPESQDHLYMLIHVSCLVVSRAVTSAFPFRDSPVPNMVGLAHSRNS